MFEFDGKKFLNEQEAIAYALDQITKIKQSLGDALPDPIPGPTGPTGATGTTGPQGPRGKGFYGVTAALPSATAYEEGDFYLISNGNIYKKTNGNWLLQCNIKGPQGPVGLEGGTDVVANPVDAYTDVLEKIKIDGTTYNVSYVVKYNGDDNPYTFTGLEAITINGNNYFVGGSWAKYLSASLYYDDDNSRVKCDDNIKFNEDIYLTDNKTIHGGSGHDKEVELSGNYYLSGSIVFDDISQLQDEDYQPLFVCENLIDKNLHKRFVDGSITTNTISGVTFTYNKWSLSGSHLMAVVCCDINAGVTLSGGTLLFEVSLPAYIKNKVVPVYADLIGYAKYIAVDEGYGTYDINVYFDKNANGFICAMNNSSNEFSSKGHLRIQFDLLIDME